MCPESLTKAHNYKKSIAWAALDKIFSDTVGRGGDVSVLSDATVGTVLIQINRRSPENISLEGYIMKNFTKKEQLQNSPNPSNNRSWIRRKNVKCFFRSYNGTNSKTTEDYE